jgi:hypothetical protein
VNVVRKVTKLAVSEAVRVDPERLNRLFVQLGEAGAEDVVCRAIEELAVRLAHSEGMWRDRDMPALRKSVRSLIAIADQVGMTALARVAGDVVGALDTGDTVTIAATYCRLLRVGERSLTAIWDLQDLSV